MWRPRKQWCRRRRLGGGPWSVSASSSSSLPRTCAADSFISAQLNWPAAVVRACPCRHRAACRFGHSSLRDLRVLKAGWVSSRLLFGRSLCGQLLCSRLLCSRLLCSDEAKVRWVGARSLRVRLGCFTNLHRQSTGNAVPRIMWTLELQRWPHIWDACGPAP